MGIKGNQAYDGRGMMTEIPTVPDFLVRFWLNITIAQVKGGGIASWYAPNMEACWDQKTRKVRERYNKTGDRCWPECDVLSCSRTTSNHARRKEAVAG
jgi:hypothetical protein